MSSLRLRLQTARLTPNCAARLSASVLLTFLPLVRTWASCSGYCCNIRSFNVSADLCSKDFKVTRYWATSSLLQ